MREHALQTSATDAGRRTASIITRFSALTRWITDYVSSLSQYEVVFFLTANSGLLSPYITTTLTEMCMLP